MSKRKKEEPQLERKYSWQFWCAVTGVIAAVALVFVMGFLSIKAMVQDVQILTYENKVEGTVTTAEYQGERVEHSNTQSSVGHSVFEKIHYVITFDEETAGYRKYEYRAENMISTEKYVGDRYLVLFNDIENPKLIQKGDILVDNIILLLFLFLIAATAIFRKKLFQKIAGAEKRLEQVMYRRGEKKEVKNGKEEGKR